MTDPDGNGGISLLIDTVQVTHAVYGGGGLDDFDTVPTTMAGGVDASLDDFGPAARQQRHQRRKWPTPWETMKSHSRQKKTPASWDAGRGY